MEDVGIDEAYLDITGCDVPDRQIAARIKDGIREQTGLTCSIGIAPNRLLAKVASDLEKPDGVTVFGEGDVQTRLWPLRIRKLYGVGPKTEACLQGMGIETIGQIAAFPLDGLQRAFGRSYGLYLYEASRGVDESPLMTHWEPKSVSRETTFQEDVGNWQLIAGTLAGLVREVSDELREDSHRAKTVTVKIRFMDFRTVTRAKTLAGFTDSEEEIRRAAFACLKRIDLDRKVRLVGVRISHFQK